MRQLIKKMKEFNQDNSGMSVIEVVLIIVVMVSLVMIFRTQITALVTTLIDNMVNVALSI